MHGGYRKKVLLEHFKWEDVTEQITWIHSGTEGKVDGYSLVVKKVGKSYMKLHPILATCGRGTFAPFPEGTYWLTTVKGRQRLLFLSASMSKLQRFGVTGC